MENNQTQSIKEISNKKRAQPDNKSEDDNIEPDHLKK